MRSKGKSAFAWRVLLILLTGASLDKLSSKIVIVESAGFKHIGDCLPDLHPIAETSGDMFDENHS